MKKWKLLSIIAVGVLAACSGEASSGIDNNEANTNDSAIISSEVFYDTPSTISSSDPENNEDVTLAKQLADSNVIVDSNANIEKNENINLYDFYKPVPIYIHLAQEAKNNIKIFIKELHKYNIPDNFDADVNEKIHVKVNALDTLGIKFYKVNVTSIESGKKVLEMKYFRNRAGNYKGNFYYSDILDGNKGNRAFVQFNGFGIAKKMTIIYKNKSGLYGEKHRDDEPTAIMVRSIKLDDKIIVKGVSFHPTFTDSFLTKGENIPSIYAFNAVADLKNNRGIIKAALAPKGASMDSIFNKYSLDKVVLNAGVETFKTELKNNSNLRAILIPMMGISDIDEINGSNLKQLLDKHPEFMENDKDLQEFNKFISLKQPIHVGPKAHLIGYESELKDSDKLIKKEQLDNDNIDEININNLEDFNMDNGTDKWDNE